MKNKEIIIKLIIVIIFLAGMIISDNNIVPNELYNKWGDNIELIALLIAIFLQQTQIANLKGRIKELEK